MASPLKAAPALLGAVFLAVAAGCSRAGQPPREKAPAFELKDLSGKTVSLSEFRGKVVLLDFWATYCGPCHDSIPFLERLYGEYRARGLEIVGIDLDSSTEQVPQFVGEMGMTYPVLSDARGAAKEAYGIRGLPATFLIDRSGFIRRKWLGFDETAPREMTEALRGLLDEKTAN